MFRLVFILAFAGWLISAVACGDSKIATGSQSQASPSVSQTTTSATSSSVAATDTKPYTTPVPIVTLDQAIAIAYESVPASVAESVPMIVWWTPVIGPDGAWQLEFDNTNATQKDLGWVESQSGILQVLVDGAGPYKIILLDVNGRTGAVILKMASTSGQRTFPPPPGITTVPPRTPPK